MVNRAENVTLATVTFFGNAPPTSGELLIGLNDYGSKYTSFSIPNHSEAMPQQGPQWVWQAAQKIVKAYMLKQPLTLEFEDPGDHLPWITRIEYDGALDIPPPPRRTQG